MMNLNTATWCFHVTKHTKLNKKVPYSQKKNGEGWASNRAEAGLTLAFISNLILYNTLIPSVIERSHIFCYFGGHLGPIRGLALSFKTL